MGLANATVRRCIQRVRAPPMASTAIPRLEEVVVLALAAARLARAVSVDEVAEPARRRLAGWATDHDDTGVASWANRLVRCPVCTGWWISLGVSLVAPGRSRLLRGVAVAGAQVALTLGERLVSEGGRVAINRAAALESAGGLSSDLADDGASSALVS